MVDGGKKIKDHNLVSGLKLIERLAFNNCGVIPNLRFLSSLKNLVDFRFVDTVIEDGDLSYCEGLKVVKFFPKKHYTHKKEDFIYD